MRVIADSNALIGLAKGQIFQLLPLLFQQVHIPTAVWEEVVTAGAGLAGEAEARAARDQWLFVEASTASTPPAIAQLVTVADREVLALAYANNAWVLSGDTKVRSVGASVGLTMLSVLDVISLARQAQIIPSVREVMDRMRAAQFGIADDDYQRLLRRWNE